MSLVDGIDPAVAAAVNEVVSFLKGGGREERAVLLNLEEEDRVPDGVRASFHARIAASAGKPIERFLQACWGHTCVLSVPDAERGRIPAAWRTFVTLKKLQETKYVSDAIVDAAEAPPRVAFDRAFKKVIGGREIVIWITTTTDRDADDVRDRLGLAFFSAGQVVYRIETSVDAKRPLHIPSALDGGNGAAWRRPPRSHKEPWGLTRDLRSDEPREPELLTYSSDSDEKGATNVGVLMRNPSDAYLKKRIP